MYKACGRCGKIHPANQDCPKRPIYRGGEERKLRNKYSWATKAQEIKARANYLCEVCKAEGKYVYDQLEVHHIEKLRDHPELLLEDENLICLCVDHHKKADDGQISQDYLRQLAAARDGKYPPTLS